jgi:hypothetical protein
MTAQRRVEGVTFRSVANWSAILLAVLFAIFVYVFKYTTFFGPVSH